MEYDIRSKIPKDWTGGHLGKMLSNIKELIFDKTLKNMNDVIGRYNLLKNDDIVEYDQKSHVYYTSRSRKM